MPAARTLEDALTRHALKTEGCWEWTSVRLKVPNGKDKGKLGYGLIQRYANKKRTITLAHRAAYELAHGPIPEGLCVLHKCDNRGCVNPDHLFLGSKGENNSDRNKKGRQARGEGHPRVKLTEQDVLEIRRTYKHYPRGTAAPIEDRPYTASGMSKRYGVSLRAIRNILNGKNWRYLKA